MDNLNYKELENLTDEERKAVLKILEEYSQQGESKTYSNIVLADYNEVPVDIITFLHTPKYLGRGLISDDGKHTIFPYWEKVLKDIFPDPLKPARYNTAVFTGAIGLGKSTIAVIAGAYELYRMLCLKNPYNYYGIQEVDKITFAVINITMDAAHGVAWTKLQNLLKSSEWFLQHGTLSKSDPPEWRPPESIELIYGSKPSHIIGRALFWCFQDEVSFRPNMDVEKQKKAAEELVSSASARMQSRFMKGEKNPTLLILASSKRTEQSYLESFIEKKKQNESTTTLIIDEPQWVIRTDKDSDRKFKVALGNKFLESEVLPLNISPLDEKYYVDKGYSILEVPMGYYENFVDNLDIALTDIAGISTSNVMKYISGARLSEVKNENLKNPFTKSVIVVGNAKDDLSQYYDFFDLSLIDPKMKSKPLYIHLDMSITGDKTGIGGVWIKGKKPTPPGQPSGKDLFYQVAFSVSIKAPKGYQISFEKNRQFIRWLRENGFSVRGVSCDSYQSADLLQQLSAEGYNTEVISLDRVKDGICVPYQVFKSAIYEQRVEIYDSKLLTEEIVGLERNNNGKIDHSPAGINSKDQADGVAGALYNASQHAEEFAFEYGEDIDNMTTVSNTPSESEVRKQIQVDFEEELKRAFSTPIVPQSITTIPQPNVNAFYLSQGIII